MNAIIYDILQSILLFLESKCSKPSPQNLPVQLCPKLVHIPTTNLFHKINFNSILPSLFQVFQDVNVTINLILFPWRNEPVTKKQKACAIQLFGCKGIYIFLLTKCSHDLSWDNVMVVITVWTIHATNATEKSPSWEASSCSGNQEIAFLLLDPKGSLPYHKEFVTGQYSQPD